MSVQVEAEKYVEGVDSIYVEKQEYQEGHDGSDGKCDCIGMCRGGLERAGATGVTNMRGTNQAARKAIEELQPIKTEAQLLLGDVVLKTRDKDDPDMPLPDRYRKGGADYDPKWGETNFTHIGTVTKTNPIEITHMTSQTAKKDYSIKGWTYSGKLPWVKKGEQPEPPPEPEPEPETAIVVAESDGTVKMRNEPTQACRLWWPVPVGSEVTVWEWNASTDKAGNIWARISWAGRDGYMMQEFLRDEEKRPDLYKVTIRNLTKDQAEELCREWNGATMEKQNTGCA